MKSRSLNVLVISILLFSTPPTAFPDTPAEHVFQINAGLNDAWYNPATPGQGFFITVFPDIQMMFLAWFTFDTERPIAGVTANLGEPGHRWMTAFGPYSADTATLDIELTRGGIFDSDTPAPTQEPDGSLMIQFTNCGEGLVTYDIPSAQVSGPVPITRVAIDNVPLCETLSGSGSNVEFWFRDYIFDDNTANGPFHMRESFAIQRSVKAYFCTSSSEYANAYPDWQGIHTHYSFDVAAGFYIVNPEDGTGVGTDIVNNVVCGSFFDPSDPMYDLVCDGAVLTKVSTWAEATEGDDGVCEAFPLPRPRGFLP